ncbi:hypothetical protein [Streptomonospora salina]|uniref:Uncharacterized protein n=1 Tax=Streptomonospora salina TaxID=104205 RepID=A0A841EKJ9_9ACTN|nr:hypothetical protein [Streptomonospora salina]MBB6000860.1 hypothetical protein [Streptomonospora salina]
MNDKYYSLIDGEPMISLDGMALLMDLPADTVRAKWQRQGGPDAGSLKVPEPWVKRGRRVRKEVAAALGYEPSLKESIDYLAAKAAP